LGMDTFIYCHISGLYRQESTGQQAICMMLSFFCLIVRRLSVPCLIHAYILF
jgi:hypothetical protein